MQHSRHDARVTTQKAREAFMARFDTQVDSDGTLDPEERVKRAAHAKSAYFSDLGRKGQAQRRAKEQKQPEKKKRKRKP